MDNLRIAVRDAIDAHNLTFIDNSADKAIHLSIANLTRYFEGNAAVANLTVDKRHEDEQYLVEGNKIAFVWRGKDYWLNIFKAVDSGHKRNLLCLSLSLELNNETRAPYEAAEAMTFKDYLKIFDPENSLTLGINEVSNKKLKLSWEGKDTILARLYSLANKFGAEIGFDTELNSDYSLKRHVLNVFIKNDGTHQGLGRSRVSDVLRVGKELKLISRSGSIEGLKTAIRAKGADGISLVGFDKKEYDANGNLEFFVNSEGTVCAPLARDRYPSFSSAAGEGYILDERDDTEYKTQAELYGYLLSELKKICYPTVEYSTEGYFDSDPGDTFSLEDAVYYNPPLLLEARVSTQTESMIGDKEQDQTEFGSFVEVKSQISVDLLKVVADMQEQINNIPAGKDGADAVLLTVSSVNGNMFKNTGVSTILTAVITVGGTIIDTAAKMHDYFGADGYLQWQIKKIGELEFTDIPLDDSRLSDEGFMLTVNVDDVDQKATFKCDLYY